MTKKPHLGRGLSALLGGEETPADLGPQRSMATDLLHPGRYQPRGRFSPDELKALAQSVKENGILQPILVRPHEKLGGHFEIVAGERRWRAAQLAQLHEVPIIVRSLDDRSTLEIALIENVQREDLTPLEEAEGYARLMAEFEYTQETLAERIGKSRSAIANLLRLRALPEAVRNLISEGKLTVGHARALITAADPIALANEIVAKDLNVRQAEALAKKQKPDAAKKKGSAGAGAEKDADTRALERDLSLKLGLKVEVQFDGKGGRLVLHYSSLDQLDGVIEKLNG
ncbi:ParB/RepB/Spo0J family partition protein [Dongia sp.]|uniref:ParB/RepB/Spo0J family partition protein n=1 Tax=Dongia sp. TaxID=1977262 RepID=UPI003752D046